MVGPAPNTNDPHLGIGVSLTQHSRCRNPGISNAPRFGSHVNGNDLTLIFRLQRRVDDTRINLVSKSRCFFE